MRKSTSYLLVPIMALYAIIPNFPALSGNALAIHKGFELTQNPYRYSAYYRDFESKMDYLKARYYSPKLMRFISRDTYDLSNKYAYCDGNPISGIDPSGHMSELASQICSVGSMVLGVFSHPACAVLSVALGIAAQTGNPNNSLVEASPTPGHTDRVGQSEMSLVGGALLAIGILGGVGCIFGCRAFFLGARQEELEELSGIYTQVRDIFTSSSSGLNPKYADYLSSTRLATYEKISKKKAFSFKKYVREEGITIEETLKRAHETHWGNCAEQALILAQACKTRGYKTHIVAIKELGHWLTQVEAPLLGTVFCDSWAGIPPCSLDLIKLSFDGRQLEVDMSFDNIIDSPQKWKFTKNGRIIRFMK